MSELVVAPKIASSPVGQRRRTGLPNLDRHLEPERLKRNHGEAITQCIKRRYCSSDIDRDVRYRDAAWRELAAMPSVQILARVAEDLDAAMDAPPDRKVTQAAVAVMFDSRVRAPQNPEIYLDALVYDLIDEGFPPAVVVAACQTLRRESTFWPEIAEVIAACRAKASSYRALASLAARLCKDRVALEAQVRASEEDPGPRQPQPSARQGNGEVD